MAAGHHLNAGEAKEPLRGRQLKPTGRPADGSLNPAGGGYLATSRRPACLSITWHESVLCSGGTRRSSKSRTGKELPVGAAFKLLHLDMK